MKPSRQPRSLAAERAVRLLRGRPEPMDSVALALEVLATRAPDERTATRVLETAFADDPRLVYREEGWEFLGSDRQTKPAPAPDRDRVLILLDGARDPERRRFEIRELAGVRLHENDVVGACGGRPAEGRHGDELREELLDLLDGAVPVVHDPPGALAAIERWLDEPLEGVISVRVVGKNRLGLPAHHDLETLVAKLGLDWREPDELLDLAEILDACLFALKKEGEILAELRASADGPELPWHRYAFDRTFLRSIPRVAGTYRFFDETDQLLYVGKARDLHRRIGSYFRRAKRSVRVQTLLEALYRIEYEPLSSDLEAILQEAIEIARREPSLNVQRLVHLKGHHRHRLRSILILEPAASPLTLRAYLIRDGRLIDKVGIGPRGGGLRKIHRLLEDHFFSMPDGPTTLTGPDVNLELVGRWLAANRDQVVAFDPTTLRSAAEVTDRLRALLASGSLRDPDGAPIHFR
jgi:hypothetical protein